MGGVCTGGIARNRAEIQRSSKSSQSFQDPNDDDSAELCFSVSRPSTPINRVFSSFLGKASTIGLGKAVQVLDTLSSSMTNLNSGSFRAGMTYREHKISILAFEIASTITKAANLLQSLSDENLQYLKMEVFPSKAVQQLVSTNMKELLTIVADEKREEFVVFSREVIRFGDMCKDPQWHNLGRYFSKLDVMDKVTHKQLRAEAEITMQELMILTQHTSELYNGLHALDEFEKQYQKKLEELKRLKLPLTGETLMMLQSEINHGRKTVRILKKKSFWFKSLEEVVEKLVDIVTFVHQEISEAFGNDVGLTSSGKEPTRKQERLGEAGLALHYANLITQIDNIALCPTSHLHKTRDSLYNGLPPTVKVAFRSQLQAVIEEKLTLSQIKAKMGKTLEWLVPVAKDTIIAHQGFGRGRELANTGNDFGKKTPPHKKIIRLQTLYYTDKQKMDRHILELVTWLHHLINMGKSNRPKAFRRMHRGLEVISKTSKVQLSLEDRHLLEEVMKREKLVPGISKSQEFVISKKLTKQVRHPSRSTVSSPQRVETFKG